jgi:hypothetical protein
MSAVNVLVAVWLLTSGARSTLPRKRHMLILILVSQLDRLTPRRGGLSYPPFLFQPCGAAIRHCLRHSIGINGVVIATTNSYFERLLGRAHCHSSMTSMSSKYLMATVSASKLAVRYWKSDRPISCERRGVRERRENPTAPRRPRLAPLPRKPQARAFVPSAPGRHREAIGSG